MNRLLTQYLCLSLFLLSMISGTQAQTKFTVSGRTCDSIGNPIEYATIILTSVTDTSTAFGAAADMDGRFEITAPAGDYKLVASFLGYDDAVKEISLNQNKNVGDLMLTSSSVDIDAVVVTAEFITREADRFVVNVEGSPMAIGQTAREMLELSPGVWVDERRGISINGKSNPQIMLNDRILRETGEDLINFLATIKAEDIKKIEIIPVAGVDQDASAQGGIIRITLRRQRENGLEGSVTMRYGTGFRKNDMEYIQPSFNLNYKINKFSMYTTVAENINSSKFGSHTESHYKNGYDVIARQDAYFRGHQPNIRLGAIYEINENHTLGIEGYYNHNYWHGTVDLFQTQTYQDTKTEVTSVYQRKNAYRPWSITANYNAKLDTVGSTFKFIFDLNQSPSLRKQYYRNYYRGAQDFDSIYYSVADAYNRLYSFNGDFDIKAGAQGRVKTGVKYSYSEVENDMAYDYLLNGDWYPIIDQTYINSYTENIAALYGSYAITFQNKMSLNAGLRAEYTYAMPKNNTIRDIDKQDYFGLFPNANFSIPFGENATHMLILNYGRKIQRPSFWDLIPRRETQNEFTYNEGNPKLDPAYVNDYSLSWVIKRKYNITAGAQTISGSISMTSRIDPDDPSVIIFYPDNTDNYVNAYLQLSLPFDVTEWWRLSTNLNGNYTNNKIAGIKYDIFSFRGNMSNSFTLYKDLRLTVDGFYMAPQRLGYLKAGHFYNVNASLRYSFGKENRYTANVYVNNLTNNHTFKQTLTSPEEVSVGRYYQNFRRLGVAFRYNFKAGKEFKVKNIESGAGEQSSRMGSGGGGQP